MEKLPIDYTVKMALKSSATVCTQGCKADFIMIMGLL